jgi:multisubunit Na+/H+ antiporter MnhE subunit
MFALWVLVTTTDDHPEIIVGAICAILVALVVVTLRLREPFVFRPRLRWVGRAVRLPRDAVRDTVVVFAALWRHATGRKQVRGAWVALPLEHGEPDDPEAGARRALAVAGMSVCPNSVAVGVDPATNELVLHSLVPDVAALEVSLRGRR